MEHAHQYADGIERIQSPYSTTCQDCISKEEKSYFHLYDLQDMANVLRRIERLEDMLKGAGGKDSKEIEETLRKNEKRFRAIKPYLIVPSCKKHYPIIMGELKELVFEDVRWNYSFIPGVTLPMTDSLVDAVNMPIKDRLFLTPLMDISQQTADAILLKYQELKINCLPNNIDRACN